MKKYDNLMPIILSRTNLTMAYKRVVGNKGAAGIDGMKVSELMAHLQPNWTIIRDQLTKGTYQPQAVKGVEIPKASGGVRLLGIPTVLDRLIQQAIHQVLNEIWDYGFSKCNRFGFEKLFRPSQP